MTKAQEQRCIEKVHRLCEKEFKGEEDGIVSIVLACFTNPWFRDNLVLGKLRGWTPEANARMKVRMDKIYPKYAKEIEKLRSLFGYHDTKDWLTRWMKGQK